MYALTSVYCYKAASTCSTFIYYIQSGLFLGFGSTNDLNDHKMKNLTGFVRLKGYTDQQDTQD